MHTDHERRIPGLILWVAFLVLITSLNVNIAVPLARDPELRDAGLFLLGVLSLLYFPPMLFIHDHLEGLMAATANLEGATFSLRWRDGRTRTCVLDGSTLVEALVPEESKDWARTHDVVEGYTFQRGRLRVGISRHEGFDRDDLVRIWPDVLAAVRRYGARMGTEMERLAAIENSMNRNAWSPHGPMGWPADAPVAAGTGGRDMATDRWQPTQYLLMSLALPVVMVLAVVVLYLATGGTRTRDVVLPGAVLVALFAAAGAGVGLIFRGLWHCHWRTAPRLGDDALDAVEAALVEAGYEPAWGYSLVTYDNYQSLQVREGTYVTFAKVRDWSGADCSHVFVGPLRGDNRRDVEVAKRLVDGVVERLARERQSSR